MEGKLRVFDKFIHVITLFLVVCLMMYYVLPMVVLRENYSFSIHDGLDGFGGTVQMLHNNHIFIDTFVKLPVMNGVKGVYLLTQYNLYEVLCITFGTLWGYIINRIIGAILGLFSMKKLLDKVFVSVTPLQSDIFWLLSASYTILPCAPNRTIAFATLPAVVYFYMVLVHKETFTKLNFLSAIFPFFSIFDSVFIFVIMAWFIATIVNWIKNKKLNFNLVFSFSIICIATVLLNINIFIIAINAKETNRHLLSNSYDGNLRSLFFQYLKGQYHAPTYHMGLLLNFTIIGIVLSGANYFYNIKKNPVYAKKIQNGILFIATGFVFWLFTTFLMAAREAGFCTGIIVIDGFQWGRALALMRFIWVFIFAILMMSLPAPKYLMPVCYIVVILQAGKIMVTPTQYNDSREFLGAVYHNYDNYMSFKDFFAEDFFAEIKKDINYNQEGVAAYGFHPSVLMFNGFNTIDGYLDVHTMDVQNAFREIIAPALDRLPQYERYYDGWGGRMYLYGELDFNPTKEKPTEAYPLYIEPEAFKNYGGKYILSRAEISNINEIGLTFVNDYDSDESIYHIYLYKVQ